MTATTTYARSNDDEGYVTREKHYFMVEKIELILTYKLKRTEPKTAGVLINPFLFRCAVQPPILIQTVRTPIIADTSQLGVTANHCRSCVTNALLVACSAYKPWLKVGFVNDRKFSAGTIFFSHTN